MVLLCASRSQLSWRGFCFLNLGILRRYVTFNKQSDTVAKKKTTKLSLGVFKSQCNTHKQPLLCVESENGQLQAAGNAVFLKKRVFGVFSKPKGIVHCGVILVTLLAKASLWASPEGSFQVLSARLELCHPSPCCQRGPSPSGCGAELNHGPLPLPATREGTLTSQL